MRKLIIVIVMGILSNIFSSCKTTEQINSYADFWNWFEKNEKNFLKIVEKRDSSEINKKFFEPLSEKLNELKDGYYFLVGMDNDSTAELIFSAEGVIKFFVFVEELVAAAPNLPNWKFIALKPAPHIENVNIEMNGYKFGSDNLYFYSND
ncbi:hypothetical protein FACS189437_06470 [Bacteroidia bacterium]|nr:hypothetical protein FACS189437_06470 [Bacteroidia bacterium]